MNVYLNKLKRATLLYCCLVALCYPLNWVVPTWFTVYSAPRSLQAPPPVVKFVAEKDLYSRENVIEYIVTNFKLPLNLARTIADSAYKEAISSDLSPFLVLALIEKESQFNPSAVSSYGAVGLMQVVPRFHLDKIGSETAQEGAKKLKQSTTNIKVGTKVLNEYLKEKDGDLDAALVKYSGAATKYATNVQRIKEKIIAKTKRSPELIASSN